MVWTEDNRKKPPRSKCELPSRQTGIPCRNWAMPNGRCRLHGGKNVPPPKGSKRALKHGLYSKGVLKDEEGLLPHIKLGSLDEEISMLKLKLRRAYIAQKLWMEQRGLVEKEIEAEYDSFDNDEEPPKRRLVRTVEELEAKRAGLSNFFPISTVETSRSKVYDQEGNPHYNYSKKILKKKEDYSAEIKSLSRLIAHLEMRRKELLSQSEDTVKNLVKGFRDFAEQAEQTLPGGSSG